MINRLSADKVTLLKNVALKLRIDSVRATTASKSGHATSCLSAADIISTLFFHTMRFDPNNPNHPNNDRFILSKGHAIPVVYAAWKHLGVISDEQLMQLRQFDSPLEGHPTPRFEHNEAATGSLGQGLSVAAGMALHARKHQLDYRTYVMIGDAESSEGSIWEAAAFCSKNKMDNIVAILDCNRLGQSGPSLDKHETELYQKKWHAFGWKTFVIDGHHVRTIANTLNKARSVKKQPVMIIAKTYKGYGIKDMQDIHGFHGKPVPEDELEKRTEQLTTFFSGASYDAEINYTPRMPSFDTGALHPAQDEHENSVESSVASHTEERVKRASRSITLPDISKDPNAHLFGITQKMATRKAFGYALAALGRENEHVYAFDGDVGNSTFTDLFKKEFPNRFIQCYVAEQNMIGVATGMDARGDIPFAATFAAFFTRAFDQIRMAAIGRHALRLSGSHAGVSIGEDGPSQMGLEDLALMRALPGSIVLYPGDAVSTYKLVGEMARYNDGISYIRTTRSSTPVLYEFNQDFPVGGCKVLRVSNNDVACIIAAGITLHEALKAHEQLAKKNISVAVVDAYSVKPLDVETIRKVARSSNNKIITVEDHYLQGGLGEAVCHALANDSFNISTLAVPNVSRSGTPGELLAHAKIDAAAIIEAVEKS